MGAVVVGGEDGLKIVARAGPDAVEKGPLPRSAPPAALDGEFCAVGQGEAADIYRVGMSVLAEAPVRPTSYAAA